MARLLPLVLFVLGVAASCTLFPTPTATLDPARAPVEARGGAAGPTKGPGTMPDLDSVARAGAGLRSVAEGLTAPVALVSPQDGTGRLFIVDQTGVIRVLMPDGELLEQAFLDLRQRMVRLNPLYDERGLLGLAFHPGFKDNGRFFVYYSAPLRAGGPRNWNHTSHVSEFRVSTDDTNVADARSERTVMQIDEPESNHNGGQITFGPDGYLYIPLGDGGAANDVGLGHGPRGNGQDKSVLLGKILRIDVDGGDPYGIPPDNPFVGTQARGEIYAYGLRNPFRIAFDAGGQHDLFAGDAGQNQWEEVDIIVKGGNYGWNIKEGAHCFDPSDSMRTPPSCPSTGADGEPLIDPIIEYKNAAAPGGIGQAVIGGFIYRGSALPRLQGLYVFGDWNAGGGDGSLFVAAPPAGQGMWSMAELQVTTNPRGRVGAYVLSFGQDADGELYVLTSGAGGPSGNTGKVFKMVPPG
ncbi:MAG: PQQ-dependent sugar dehydrogenase [Bacteroidetes bacterium]|nr:PQQ-dependent sugar dehydrogenase [Bacteroidota bacterium]